MLVARGSRLTDRAAVGVPLLCHPNLLTISPTRSAFYLSICKPKPKLCAANSPCSLKPAACRHKSPDSLPYEPAHSAPYSIAPQCTMQWKIRILFFFSSFGCFGGMLERSIRKHNNMQTAQHPIWLRENVLPLQLQYPRRKFICKPKVQFTEASCVLTQVPCLYAV